MKKSITIIAILILALAAAAFAYVQLTKQPVVNGNQNGNQNTNTATTTEDVDTSDWKTYRNEQYGFEIKYGLNYSIQENLKKDGEKSGGLIFWGNVNISSTDFGQMKNPVYFYFYDNPDNLDGEAWFTQSYNINKKSNDPVDQNWVKHILGRGALQIGANNFYSVQIYNYDSTLQQFYITDKGKMMVIEYKIYPVENDPFTAKGQQNINNFLETLKLN